MDQQIDMHSLFALIFRQCMPAARSLEGISNLFFTSTYWAFIVPFRGMGSACGPHCGRWLWLGRCSSHRLLDFLLRLDLLLRCGAPIHWGKFGALNYVVDMAAVTITREWGPLRVRVRR